MRILIIEDSVRLADTIADALRDENYIVDIANDGLQGYENAASGIYDMLILDLDAAENERIRGSFLPSQRWK